jgi:signal peptide peptidase SppA
MRNLDLIFTSFFNTPLLLDSSKAEVLSDVLIRALASRDLQALQAVAEPQGSAFIGAAVQNSRGETLYRRTTGGVAIVPVNGSLTNRGSWVGASSGMVGYEGLTHQVRAAAGDHQVRAILLDINSPGGTVAGAFEAAAAIREIDRTQKPVFSIANSMTASAAYLLASATRRIFAPETAIVGSIGVIVSLFDQSKRLENEGIRPVIIRSVEDKARPSGVEPITSDQIARLQADVDRLHELFGSTVTRNRPKVSSQVIADLKGRTLLGDEALKIGLIDQLAGFEATVRAIEGLSLNKFESRKGLLMTEFHDETPASARASERQRIAGIFKHEGAAAFPSLASMMIDGDFSAELAGKIFEAASADAEATAQARADAAAEAARADAAAEIEALKQDQATKAAAVAALAQHDPRLSDEDVADAPKATIADFMKNKFRKD